MSVINIAVNFLVDISLVVYLCLKWVVLRIIPRSLRYKDLKGEVVLITGGASGIGRQLAIKLSKLGCRVVVWDVNARDNEETARLIREDSCEGYAYVCDVTNRDEVYAMARRIKDELGSVTILINNAGVVSGKRLLDCPDHLIENTFRVNVLAHFWTCKAFLPDMIANNHGHIVTVASVLGFIGISGLSDYTSSKSAAITFHDSLYMDLQKSKLSGIKTTLVCPYHIKTDMFKGIDLRLLPSLEVDDAVDEIISSIRCDEETAIIPWYYRVLVSLRSLIPLSASTKLLEIVNAPNVMDTFVGSAKASEDCL